MSRADSFFYDAVWNHDLVFVAIHVEIEVSVQFCDATGVQSRTHRKADVHGSEAAFLFHTVPLQTDCMEMRARVAVDERILAAFEDASVVQSLVTV